MATDQKTASELTLQEVQQRIGAALQGLRFGCVEIQVHDSRIVRITRTEKVRVDANGPEPHSSNRTHR